MADPNPKSGNLRVTGTPVPADDASSQALNEALGSSFVLVRLLMVALLAAFVFSCVFTVNPNEVAVVLRFGEPVGTGAERIRRQGLHWAFPPPIDEVVKIPVGEARSVRAIDAWYAVDPAQEITNNTPPVVASLSPGVHGHVLTSDGNILHVRATMRYRISDPLAYQFAFSNSTNLLTGALDNAIHWASVRFTADAALYQDIARFRDTIRQRVTETVDRAKLGIVVDGVNVEVAVPGYVKEAFDQVTAADQDRDKKIKEARGQAEQTTVEAKGEADRILASARGASNALVQAVFADARSFQDQLPYYRENPALFTRRLRTEAIARVLTNSQDKFFLPSRGDGQPRELRLNLNREPESPKPREEAPAQR